MSDDPASAIRQFFAVQQVALIEARCNRCGSQVAIYYGYPADVGDDDGWKSVARCVCKPQPRLLAGDQLFTQLKIAKGKAAQRYSDDRAPHKVRI